MVFWRRRRRGWGWQRKASTKKPAAAAPKKKKSTVDAGSLVAQQLCSFDLTSSHKATPAAPRRRVRAQNNVSINLVGSDSSDYECDAAPTTQSTPVDLRPRKRPISLDTDSEVESDEDDLQVAATSRRKQVIDSDTGDDEGSDTEENSTMDG